MRSFNLFALLSLCMLLACVIFAGQAEAAMCSCNFKEKGAQVCGTNGVTFVNRCEFECTQRDYKKLGRTLNIAKMGPC